MKILFLILCFTISFAAAAEKLTIEEANNLLYEGLLLKDIDKVLEALESGAQLDARVADCELDLFSVANLPPIDPTILALTNQYLIKGSAALDQFRHNRERHNNNNVAVDAGSETEIVTHNSTSSDDPGYLAIDGSSGDDDAHFGASLTLSLSLSSPRI